MDHQDRVWLGFALFLGAIVLSIIVAFGYLRRIPKKDLPRRSIGITCPWDFRQFLVVVLFLYIELTYWGFIWPSMNHGTSVIGLIIHSVVAGTTVVLFVRMVSSDPQEGLVAESIPGNPPNKYCGECNAWFPGVKRRHCSRCKRCVTGFDHHCWFVNTCISHDTNYWSFIALAVSFWSTSMLQIITAAIVLAVHAGSSSGDLSIDPVSDYYGNVVFVFNLIFTEVVGFLGTCGLSLLIGFHIFLKCTNSSTSEFIQLQFEDEEQSKHVDINIASPTTIEVGLTPKIELETVSGKTEQPQSISNDQSGSRVNLVAPGAMRQ